MKTFFPKTKKRNFWGWKSLRRNFLKILNEFSRWKNILIQTGKCFSTFKWHCHTLHNDVQNNDSQHNSTEHYETRRKDNHNQLNDAHCEYTQHNATQNNDILYCTQHNVTQRNGNQHNYNIIHNLITLCVMAFIIMTLCITTYILTKSAWHLT